ncbi:MAG: DUF2007 domain-containing protein [Bacteroidota bacterium]
MDNPSLKEVVRLADPIKASMLRSVLENEGIESVLFEGMISQLAPHHTAGQGGMRLMVKAADYFMAKPLVEQALGIEEWGTEEAASRNARSMNLAFGILMATIVLAALGALLFGGVA